MQFRFLGNSGPRSLGGWPGHVLEAITAACRSTKVTCDMQVKFDSNGGDHLETAETEIEKWCKPVSEEAYKNLK